MTTTVKHLGSGRVELTIDVPVDELKPHLDRATRRLAEKISIPGFRPGKAPSAMILARAGAMAIIEEASQDVITQTLYQALKQENIDSIGRPDIAIEKMAPDNPLVYKATVSIMPTVQLGEWKTIKVKKKPVVVPDADADKVIDDLRAMQASEALVDRPARNEDKVEVNFEVKRDNIVIEGGKGDKYPLVLGKGSMIPGFEEQIVGLKAGDKKTFSLKFPEPYMQESLAGKEAQFDVEVLGVYERTLPEKTDEWAKMMSGKDFKELSAMVKGNLQQEKEAEERHRVEQEIMEKLIEKATYTDIPDILVQSEQATMLAELKEDIAQRRMKWEQYLTTMKKTEKDIEKELQPLAVKRVKGALIMRNLAKELTIYPTEEEIHHEIDHQKEMYKDNVELVASLDRPEAHDYFKRSLSNRKVMEELVLVLTE